MKRALSLILVLAMMLSVVPAVYAAEDEQILSIEENIVCNITDTTDEYGYYWVAEADGLVTVVGGSENPEETSITWYVGDGEEEYDAGAEKVSINAGQELWIFVGCDTEGEVSFGIDFVTLPGTEGNPITLLDTENTVDIAGKTYYQGKFHSATMTVTGTGAFSVTHNEETVNAVNGVATVEIDAGAANALAQFVIDGEGQFAIVFTYPVGSNQNPAELKLDANAAYIEAGNSEGYYFTYTAAESGILTVTMPEGDWVYSVTNETAGLVSSTIYSDDEDAVASTSVELLKDDVVKIMVNTYNPADMWNNPAGTLVVTASFEAGEVEDREPDVIEGNMSASNVSLEKNETITVSITPGENTTLGLNISGDPMYGVSVNDGDEDPENNILLGMQTGTSNQYYWQVLAGTTYQFTIRVMDSTGWAYSAGTVSYTFTLDAEVVEQKQEYMISETALDLGTNTVAPMENAITTIYVFAPAEPGVYTVTPPGWATVGIWGYSTALITKPGQAVEGPIKWTCTSVGQSLCVGVSDACEPGETFNIIVERTGDYEEVEI